MALPCKQIFNKFVVIAHDTKESPYLFGITLWFHDFNGLNCQWEAFYACYTQDIAQILNFLSIKETFAHLH